MSNVHKDFHGCMSFALSFMEREFGPAELEAYLRRLARNAYAPLIESLRLRGLPALEDHWRRIMTLEGADFSLTMDGASLVLEVCACPAIHHMRSHGYPIAPHFCESTRIVNDEICQSAGYTCATEYDQDAGRCTQRFSREAGR